MWMGSYIAHKQSHNYHYELVRISAENKIIFVLGGRPLNWLWVSNECLALLNELTERITLENNNNHPSIKKSRDSLRVTPSRIVRGIVQSLRQVWPVCFIRRTII